MIAEIFSVESFVWTCLWQSMAIIVVGLAASFLLKRRSARAHQILLLSIVAAVIVPVISTLVKHYELGMFVAEPVSIPSELDAPTAASDFSTSAPIAYDFEYEPRPVEADSPPIVIDSQSAPLPWARIALYGWIAASLMLATRLLVTFALGVRLLGRAQPLDCVKMKAAVHSVRTKLGINREVEVCSSLGVRSPVIWCWKRRPVLLMPTGVGGGDSTIDWTGVLCHELAHWKRRDHISGLLAETAVCILPWHLLLWWAKSRLTSLSEQACDDWVIATGQPGADYAESLLNLTPGSQMAFVPAVISSKKGLAGRIRRILKDSCGNPRTGAAWAMAVSVAAICLAAGIAFAQTRPAKPPAASEPEEKAEKERRQGITTTFPTPRTVDEAKMDYDIHRMRRLGAAIALYVREHDQTMPNTVLELKPYLPNKDDLIWAIDDVALLARGKLTQSNAAQKPIACDAALAWKRFETVAVFADFSVRRIGIRELEQLGVEPRPRRRTAATNKWIMLHSAAKTYAKEHDGKLPDTLDALRPYAVSEQYFQWLVVNAEYLAPSRYLGTMQSWAPIACEKEPFANDQFTMVLFADGHTESMYPKEIKKLTRLDRRVKESADNLMRIGRGLLNYANDHGGKYPDTGRLDELREYLKTEEFARPIQSGYLGKGRTTADRPDIVICHDIYLMPYGKGTNVLFNDGHVEFADPERLNDLSIDASRGY